MKRHIQIPAIVENWNLVHDFLQEFIDEMKIDRKIKSNVLLSSEEIFVNIARYAYPGSQGDVLVDIGFSPQEGIIQVKFRDAGIPFDPTKWGVPDIHQSLEERKIGGLGIFMVRKMMDEMQYFYEDGANNLLIIKKMKIV